MGLSLDPPTEPSLFNLLRLEKRLKHSVIDIRDREKVRHAVEEFRPEIVFHMAAQPLVRDSFEIPVETYEINVMGTVYLLDALRRVDTIRSIVAVTSDKCYENKEWIWGYRENEAMGGFDPYSNSKGCAELVSSAFRQSFYSKLGVGLATARAGNVIGGGDWAKDRLVPDLILAFQKGETAIVRNPKAIRPWQHVLEPLSGYMLLAQKLFHDPTKFSEGWNFGPSENDNCSVEKVANLLCKYLGEGFQWQTQSSETVHEAALLRLDSSKARMKLNWQPRLTIEKALEWTALWAKHLKSHGDAFAITMEQIQQYEKLSINEKA